MPRSVLRVGTRGSMLALAQAESVRRAVSHVITHRNFELVPVTTLGDRTDGPVPTSAVAGAFTRDIEDALVTGKIDLAVHRAEDLASETQPGVVIGGIPAREDPRDVLLTRNGLGLNSLQPGATIGTASLLCSSQLLALGKGLVPTPIYGTLDSRLRMLTDGDVQALVVPLAGLKRLGRADRVAEILPINVMLPAPGQGALVVQCRSNDKMMRAALGQIEDPLARAAYEAERTFSIELRGDRMLPVGALADATADRVRLRGLVGSTDGRRIITEQIEGDDPEKVALQLAERMRALGASEILPAN